MSSQFHTGQGDNVAGNKKVIFKNATLVIFLVLSLGIVSAILIKNSGKQKFECEGHPCETCKDCYELGCFEQAHLCLQQKKKRTDEDERRKRVAKNVLLGNKSWDEPDFIEALDFYKKAIKEDSVIVYTYKKKHIAIAERTQEAELAMVDGDYEKAERNYNYIKSETEAKGVEGFDMVRESSNQQIEIVSDFKAAEALMKKGDYGGALSNYQTIIRKTKASASKEFEVMENRASKYTQMASSFQKAEAAMRTKNYTEALEYYKLAKAEATTKEFGGLELYEERADKKIKEIKILMGYKINPSPSIELTGTWKQFKSGKGGEIQGTISFNYPKEKKATYTNIYFNDFTHKGELEIIKVDADSISGTWHNSGTQQSGKFSMKKSGEYSLTGRYSLSDDEAPRYYWNATKTK